MNMENKPQLKILLCGRTGVGKSSLINSLLGRVVCKVGDPGLDNDGLDGCTMSVVECVVPLKGVDIHIFDSPGLQDGTGDDAKYAKVIYRRCKDVDLVLYCMEMTASRFTDPEKRAIDLITTEFGTKFWERCVIVLTKANIIRVPAKMKNAPIEYHENIFGKFCDKFRSLLADKNVVFNDTRIVAAGHFDFDCENDDPDRYIFFASKNCKATPNKKVDFVTELWMTCLETLPKTLRSRYLQASALGRIKEDGKEPTGRLRAMLDKATKELEKSISKSELPKPTIHPAIDVSPSQVERLCQALEYYGTEFGQAVGFECGLLGGALSGAYVGALAAGPVGLLIGGAVGVGVGIPTGFVAGEAVGRSAGVAAGKAIKYVTSSENETP